MSSAGPSTPFHGHSISDALKYNGESDALPPEPWGDLKDVFSAEDLHMLFPNADDPGRDLDHLDESWSNIQEWADLSLNLPASNEETIANAIDTQMEIVGAKDCCYGAIYNVPIKLVGNMLQISETINSDADQSFDVLPHSEYYMLKFAEGGLFAQVCESVSRGFHALKDCHSVEMKATVDMRAIKEVLARAKRPGEATSNAYITIYGSQDEGLIAGKALSSNKIFLQDPEEDSETVPYYNPQEARFPGIEEPVSTVLDRSRAAVTSSKGQKNELESEIISQAIATIYRSLKRFRIQDQQKGGARVLTNLLHHQQTALHFMIQREYGPVPESFSFWHVDRNAHSVKYQHKITGIHTEDRPFEEGGGILADDMGMGKTLTTLALIEATSAEATSWASQPPRTETDYHRELPRIKSTLIIVPSTLIVNSWMKQIETHIEKSFKAVAYYGKDRDANSDAYFDSDVVFTTYHTVAASINLPNNLIVPIQWFRIVLDEAHMIRRPQTTLFQAASQLSARFRWCLTGTPIQNRLEDVGSLLSFLRVPHLENKAVFQKYVILPFEEDPEEACRKFAFLLDCICLRRPQTLLYLPKMVETVHYLDLSPSEQQQYRNTMQAMSKMLQRKAGQGPGKKVTFGLFQAQLQLRILCNHGTFQKRITDTIERDTQAESEDIMYSLGRQADDSCSICSIQISIFDTVGRSRTRQFKCGHRVCQECALNSTVMGTNTTTQCQLCGSEATSDTASPPAKSSIGRRNESSRIEAYFHTSGHSSKMAALMHDLDSNRGSGKSIVFSSWTRTLDLIVIHLDRLKLPYVRIDGSQSSSQRQYNLDRFTSYHWIPILLMSTGVGAVGLNLTAANRVYIVEPQWNPSIESQAIGRISRIGQERTVYVTRYLVRGTVEMKMYSQQVRKIELARIGLKS